MDIGIAIINDVLYIGVPAIASYHLNKIQRIMIDADKKIMSMVTAGKFSEFKMSNISGEIFANEVKLNAQNISLSGFGVGEKYIYTNLNLLTTVYIKDLG
jgi:hypothetical protein